MYQRSTTKARPTYVSPLSTAATTGFGVPSAVLAGMYVPMARVPSFF